MEDAQKQFELGSIDRLARERGRTAQQSPGLRMVDGEARSWAPAVETAHATQPWIPTRDHRNRLAYETVTEAGARVSVVLTCEPVWDLGRGEPVAGYLRERRRLISGSATEDQQAPLSPADQVRLEGLKFRRGLALLEEQGPGYGVMTSSWSMLTRSRGPFTALNTGVRGRIDPAVRLIGEIADIPAGAAPKAVREVVSYLGERRRTVMLRVPPDSEALDVVAGSGARGVCYSLAGPALETQQGWSRLAALLAATRRLAPMILLDHVSPEHSDQLLASGATHAVFDTMRARLV